MAEWREHVTKLVIKCKDQNSKLWNVDLLSGYDVSKPSLQILPFGDRYLVGMNL